MKSRNRAEQKNVVTQQENVQVHVHFKQISYFVAIKIVRCPSIQLASLAKQQFFRQSSWTSKLKKKNRKYDFYFNLPTVIGA